MFFSQVSFSEMSTGGPEGIANGDTEPPEEVQPSSPGAQEAVTSLPPAEPDLPSPSSPAPPDNISTEPLLTPKDSPAVGGGPDKPDTTAVVMANPTKEEKAGKKANDIELKEVAKESVGIVKTEVVVKK